MRYEGEEVDLQAVIKQLREESGVSFYKLADMTGIHVNNLKNYVYKKPNGRLGYFAIARILRALNYSMADIWRVHNERNRK